MEVKFFNPGKEFQLNEEEYTKEWLRVRRAGDLILRNDVEEFETELAKYVGTKYAVGLNSGTDALLIALKALGIKEGDKILVPSHTFVATAQVVNQLGAEVVLYDLGDDIISFIDIKCLIVAHIAGEIGIRFQDLLNFAKNLDIPIIEDACQALGATQNGRKAGSFGKAGAFSFYPAKILGGPGDGGALVTDDEEIYKFAIEYRNHWKKDYTQWGINSRLDNVLAAELNLKLSRIDKTLARRKEIAQKYQSLEGTKIFSTNDLAFTLPNYDDGRVWQDYILRVLPDDTGGLISPLRNVLYDFLKANGVETMKNEYPMPCGKLPNAKEYEAETLRLPINEVITDEEVDYVIEKIKEFYESNNSPTV